MSDFTIAGNSVLDAVRQSFEYHQQLAERAVAQLSDDKLHATLDPNVNSIAVVMKHVGGNLRSRWTDFLTTDGEKPWRNRDDEFVDTFASREEVMQCWRAGWDALYATLAVLTPPDLLRTVTVRGEPHSVSLALTRSLAHTAYHVGQIVQTARVLAGENWETLTIARGGSQEFNEQMRQQNSPHRH